jgi:hypothetical protein
VTLHRQKPTLPEVEPLVRAYYAKSGNSVGGNLHVVLDDCNIKDANIRYCLKECHRLGDGDGASIAELMLQMSRRQRKRLANLPDLERG